MNSKKEISSYVRNNVEFFEERLQLALNKMDANRCPLKMADYQLFSDIRDAIKEWCEDNDFDVDHWEDWDDLIDGEDGIIWEE